MWGDFFICFGDDFVGFGIYQIIGWVGVVYMFGEEFGDLVCVLVFVCVLQFVINGIVECIYDVFLIYVKCVKQCCYWQFVVVVDVCEYQIFGVEFKVQLVVVIGDDVVGEQQFV